MNALFSFKPYFKYDVDDNKITCVAPKDIRERLYHLTRWTKLNEMVHVNGVSDTVVILTPQRGYESRLIIALAAASLYAAAKNDFSAIWQTDESVWLHDLTNFVNLPPNVEIHKVEFDASLRTIVLILAQEDLDQLANLVERWENHAYPLIESRHTWIHEKLHIGRWAFKNLEFLKRSDSYLAEDQWASKYADAAVNLQVLETQGALLIEAADKINQLIASAKSAAAVFSQQADSGIPDLASLFALWSSQKEILERLLLEVQSVPYDTTRFLNALNQLQRICPAEK